MAIDSRVTRVIMIAILALLLVPSNLASAAFVSENTSDSPSSPADLMPGSTVRHKVASGEWLMQIARCYGADYDEVRHANPQISNPSLIWTGQVVHVPNIGSQGTIYGPPCVFFHNAVDGDTWQSLAEHYNAGLNILKRANPVRLRPGARIKIPVNSAGGTAYKEPLIATATLERAADYLGDSSKYDLLWVLGVFNGSLHFFGDDGAVIATFSYDGSVVGFSGIGVFAPGIFTEYKGEVYYPVIELGGDYGYELWKFNGTDETLAADIAPGWDDSSPSYLTIFNDELYFSANVWGRSGDELWKYDGVKASLVQDIVSGPIGSSPKHLVVFNDELYFAANGNDGAGRELWKYDGTRASRVDDINPGSASSSPRSLAVYNGALYFAANGGDGAGTELWRYDGIDSSCVADLLPGMEGSFPDYLTVYNGRLYFSVYNDDGGGDDLWTFDGSTVELGADILGAPEDAELYGLTVYNGALYFIVESESVDRELWRYTNSAP